MIRSNPLTGVILFLVATLCIVLMNTCAKISSPSLNPAEMVFYRGIIVLGLLGPYMLLTQPRAIFLTHRPKVHIIRGLAGNLGVGFVFWAYSLLPMADATALLFASPLFVTVLSPVLLKEKVGCLRWLAVLIGFAGVLIIVRPSSQVLSQPAALIGVLAAFFIALVDITLRHLGRTDSPLTTVFYFMVVGVCLTGPYVAVAGHLPSVGLLPWILAMSGFALIQQLAKTAAFSLAEASMLAPYNFTAIVWAVLTGWLFWHDWPSLAVVGGTIVIISGNLVLIWREYHDNDKRHDRA